MSAPVNANGAYRFAYYVLASVRPLLFNLHVENRELVLLDRGGVLVSNHPGGFDFLALGLACPRQIHYMAKVELFQVNPLVSAMLRSMGVFPVRRGHRDMGAIEAAIELVQSGKILGMFPEGTRNRREHMTRGKSGAARVALTAGVPIIPAAVVGAVPASQRWYRQLKRPRIDIRFGEPFMLRGNADEQTTVHQATVEIMLSIARLLPPEKRGEYAELVIE
jgi:1-acyl-sn-glycerol-3-phosphate acyltransferase